MTGLELALLIFVKKNGRVKSSDDKTFRFIWEILGGYTS